MNWRAARRVAAFFGKRRLDRELEDELAAHVEFAIEENLERGLPWHEARRVALASMGGLEQAKDRHRQARGLMRLDILLQDLKYTFRTLGRDPGFTAVAILILALGVGANIAVFSVVDTLMLRPLPFPNAQELVWIAPPPQKCGLSCATYSTDAYDEFRTYSHSYQDVTGYFSYSSPENLNLFAGNGAPIPATGIDVIANFFNVLGVQPAMGRLFRPADALDGAAPVIVLSNPWWRRQFHADPQIIGKAFDINGRQTTVVGVLPASFDFGAVFSPGSKVDAITPLDLYGPPRGWGNIITFIGRMKPGVTLAQARDDARSAAPHLCWNNRNPQTCGSYVKAGIVPDALKEYVSGRLRRSLIVLWSAVGLILLIACVNLSNLLLARAMARSKEFAMRATLGASRSRIVGQLLTESLILSAAGSLLGLALAYFLIFWLAHQGAIALPLLGDLRIDRAALAWTFLIAVGTAFLFGIFPGLRMAGGQLAEALKDSGAGAGQSRRHERVRSVLVVTEVALACVLLVGAGLLLRSFLRVLNIDLGFQPERGYAMRVDVPNFPVDGNANTPQARQAVTRERTAFFQQVIARVTQLPGVQAAGISDYLPLGQNRAWGTPWPKGVKQPDALATGPLVYVVTPGYLRAMGTPLRGRDFSWDDGPTGQNVIIISQAYAQFLAAYAHWPNEDPVGHTLSSGDQDLTIIGVAANVHEETTEGDAGWQIYYPQTQASPTGAQLVLRSTLPASTGANAVLQTLRTLNPSQTASELRPIQSFVDHANSPRRFFMFLVVAFAALGLLLAALGIYGVISYSVTRRTQEIGIRMALGATIGRVQWQVLAGTVRLALMGIALGAVASLAAARLIASLLYATSPWDLPTYLGMVAALLAVAVGSGYLPARRASRTNPMVALRAN
ncbi:MAG TPA: ABC transporter permease [Terracidiphilus sp.]|jgi:predicted permease